MAIISKQEFKNLKDRINTECKKRCHRGSISALAKNFTEDTTVIKISHYNELVQPLNKIKSDFEEISVGTSKVITKQDLSKIEVALKTYEDEKLDAVGSCRSSCTGLCYGCTASCSTGCSGCYGCGSGCSSSCYGGCKGSCKGGCYQGCMEGCTDACSGCGGNCSTRCASDCEGGCTKVCGYGCGGSCSGGGTHYINGGSV